MAHRFRRGWRAVGKLFPAKTVRFPGICQNATMFLFRYTSITYAVDFNEDLTRSDKDDFLSPLQPKSGFLPEARRGRPKLRKNSDGANEAGQPVSRPLSRPSPTANLAGNWKGDPLGREVRGFQVHPGKMLWRCCVYRGSAVYWQNYVGRNLYRSGFWVFPGVLHLCSRL